MVKVVLSLSIMIAFSANGQQLDPDAKLVLVSRGKSVVTMGDMDALLASAPVLQRPDIVSSSDRVEQLLDSSLLAKQLASRGRNLGLLNDPEVQLRLAFATEKALGEIVLDVLVNRATNSGLEALAKETYAAKKFDFVAPEKWSVQHLLVKANENENDVSLSARAALIYKQAILDGADFPALVKTKSQDPSVAQNDGVFEIERDSEFVEEFLNATIKLSKPLQFAPLTKTQFGFHIIRLLEKSESKQLTYDEVRPQIMASLSESFRERTKAEILSDLRAADPKYIEENIRKLIVRYDPPAQATPPVDGVTPSSASASGAPK